MHKIEMQKRPPGQHKDGREGEPENLKDPNREEGPGRNERTLQVFYALVSYFTHLKEMKN
jgi:hypothetical protein